MIRATWLAILMCFGAAITTAHAQPDPPSIDPSALPPGFVEDRFYGPEVRLENTTLTSNVQLNPLEVRELFQAPELTDPAGAASLDDRLFRHDYLFTVPEQVFGVANINDLNLTIGSRLLEDILQLTFGLFEDGVLSGNLIAGLATDPPGGDRATISFSDLVPGTQYIMRVAGVLNGFAVIPGTGGTFGWHGQYQGNIAVVPLPGAVLLFLTALGGLGIVRLRGRKSA